jgi:hypothetical protein
MDEEGSEPTAGAKRRLVRVGKPRKMTFAPIEGREDEQGWLRCTVSDVEAQVDLRFTEQPDGSFRITAIWLEHADGIEAVALRNIPLGAITDTINGWGELPDRARRFVPGEPAKGARADHARALAAKLRVPERQPYGDAFYQALAETYAACRAAGLPAAKVVAGAQQVPMHVVYGWARVARQRGLLQIKLKRKRT